ncbi:MAG: prepilin-type N-terminal cleavage/methylation domain-containing protein [bacterium]
MRTPKKSFTLLEVIVAVTLFLIIFTTIISLYTKMVNIKYTIQAQQAIIQ